MVATRQMTKARAAKQGGSNPAVRELAQAGASKTVGPSTSTVARRCTKRGAADNCTYVQGEGGSVSTLHDVKEAEESASTASVSNSKGKKGGSARSSGTVQTTTTTTTTTQTCGLYLEVKIEHISASVSGHSGASPTPPQPPEKTGPRKARGTKKAPAKGGKPKANTKRGKAAEKTGAVPENETVVTGSKRRRREDADDEDEGRPETSLQGSRRTRRKIEPPADQDDEPPVVRRTRSRKAAAAVSSRPELPKPRVSRRKAQAGRAEPASSKSQVTKKEVPSHDDDTEAGGKVRRNKGKGKAVDLPSTEVASVGSKRRRDEEDVDVEDVTHPPVDPGPSRRTTRRTRQKVEGPVKSETSMEVARPRRRTTKTKAANKGKGKAKDETPEPTEPKRESPEYEERSGQRSPGATNPVLVKQESQYSSPVPPKEEPLPSLHTDVPSTEECKKEEPPSSPLRLLLTAMEYPENGPIALLETHASPRTELTPTLRSGAPPSPAMPQLESPAPTLTLKPEESMLILAPRRVLPESAIRGTYNGDDEETHGSRSRSPSPSEADDDDDNSSNDSLSAVIPAWSRFISSCRKACANMGSFAASSLAQQRSGNPAAPTRTSTSVVPKSGAPAVAANCVSSVTPGARSEKDERSPTSSSEVSEMLGGDARSDSEDDETSPCRTSGALRDGSHRSLTCPSPPSRRSLTTLPVSPEQRNAGSSSMALVPYKGFEIKTDHETPRAGPSRLPERTPSPSPSDVSFPSDSFGLHSDDEIEIEWTGGPEPAPEPPTPPPIRAARLQIAPRSTSSPSKPSAGPSERDNREEDHDRIFHTEDEVPPELKKAYRFARSTPFSYLRGGVREKTLLSLQKSVFGLDRRLTVER
ncbi:hypothetical protein ACEPAF_1726 [Sanghuangporus sanghuang]